jgi:hypothetical protein
MNLVVNGCLILFAGFTFLGISASAQSSPGQSVPTQSHSAQTPLLQSLPGDSTIRSAEEHAIAIYHNYLGQQSPVYNGTGHITDDPNTRGFAYFQSPESFAGSVVYDGSLYSNLPILYDIVRDQVIVADRYGYLIGLFMPRVKEFSLYGHHFISTSRGVYDLLVPGAITILAKRTKKIEESIVGLEIIHTVYATDYFFAVKDSVYYELHNQRSLLMLMDDRKKEIKEFIKAGRIKFNKDPEGAICRITAYYNQLIK